MPSRLDEGAFLIKGYYYWVGKYASFEDFGLWTNKIPLAYYIPGLAQYLFGPGLLKGRYFAIFLTFLTFLAHFFLVKRLTNQWWALLAIMPLAVNPALLMVYVRTISEGVAACLLSWSLFFFIGKDRKTWQICEHLSFSPDSPDTAKHDLTGAFRFRLCSLVAWEKIEPDRPGFLLGPANFGSHHFLSGYLHLMANLAAGIRQGRPKHRNSYHWRCAALEV